MTATRPDSTSLGTRAAITVLGATERTLGIVRRGTGRFLDRIQLRLRAKALALDPQSRRRAEEVRKTDWDDPVIPEARERVERWLESQPGS